MFLVENGVRKEVTEEGEKLITEFSPEEFAGRMAVQTSGETAQSNENPDDTNEETKGEGE